MARWRAGSAARMLASARDWLGLSLWVRRSTGGSTKISGSTRKSGSASATGSHAACRWRWILKTRWRWAARTVAGNVSALLVEQAHVVDLNERRPENDKEEHGQEEDDHRNSQLGRQRRRLLLCLGNAQLAV